MTRFVLFATGSPVIVDVEESARRCGHRLVAGIRNRETACYLAEADKSLPLHEADDQIRQLPFLVPLFTPINRHAAVLEATTTGFLNHLTLIDPSAIVPSSLTIGTGSYIGPGVSIGAQSTLGNFVFINRSTTLGHHFKCGDFVSIGPGAVLAGQIEIEHGATIGAGAVVLPGLRIGSGSFVAAGAVVTRNVPPVSLVAGNPARLLRTSLTPWPDPGSGYAPEQR